MGAPERDTKPFQLRVEADLIALLKELQLKTESRSKNKFSVFLLSEALKLLANPDSCPPLSPEFIRLRQKLHGGSGSYADEPGRVVATGPTVTENAAVNEKLADSIAGMVSILIAKDAEIAALRASNGHASHCPNVGASYDACAVEEFKKKYQNGGANPGHGSS